MTLLDQITGSLATPTPLQKQEVSAIKIVLLVITKFLDVCFAVYIDTIELPRDYVICRRLCHKVL